MAHRHSQSCLLVQALRPALAACLAASGLNAWFPSGHDAQHFVKSSGSASATYSTHMLHQVAQRQHAGSAWLPTGGITGAGLLPAPSNIMSTAALPATMSAAPHSVAVLFSSKPLVTMNPAAQNGTTLRCWRSMASNHSRRKRSQRGPAMPTSSLRFTADMQRQPGSSPLAAAATAPDGSSPSRAERLANMWSPDAVQRRMRRYAIGMMALGLPLLGWVVINHSIIGGGRDMLKSPHPLFQQTAARRLRFVLFADIFAERMVALGIPELLLQAVHRDQDPVALQEVLRTLAMLLQHEVSRDALIRAGIVQHLDSATRQGWLPGSLEKQAAAIVALLQQDAAYSQRKQWQPQQQQ